MFRLFITLLAIATITACSNNQSIDSDKQYLVPDNLWSVELVAGQHSAHPQIYVTIDESYSWPSSEQQALPVHYRVNVYYPDGKILDAGRITADERFAMIWVLPDYLADDLELAPQQDQETIAANRRQRGALLEQPIPESLEGITTEFAQWQTITPRYTLDWQINARTQVRDYQVSIEPYSGDRGLVRQEAPFKQPQQPRFTWGRVGQQLAVPCNNTMTPEACVELRLQRFRDQVCNAQTTAGQPLYPQQCRKLREFLSRQPSGFVAACTIPVDDGVIGGFYNPADDNITLNGDYFLTGICPEATVWHELSHALDKAAGRMDAITRLKQAEDRLKDADRRGAQAVEDGRLDEARRQLRRYRQAELDIFEIERRAGREQIETECRALFATIDQSPLFGYPGAAGLPWMKENIISMVGELSAIRSRFNLAIGSPPVKGPMCSCFRRMLQFVDDPANAAVKTNYLQDVIKPGSRITKYRLLSGLTGVYCR